MFGQGKGKVTEIYIYIITIITAIYLFPTGGVTEPWDVWFLSPGCKKCQQHTPVVADGGGRWGGGQNADGHTWVSIRRILFARHRARQKKSQCSLRGTEIHRHTYVQTQMDAVAPV